MCSKTSQRCFQNGHEEDFILRPLQRAAPKKGWVGGQVDRLTASGVAFMAFSI